jgi:2,4-diketo-3-deoxy-L-fuconate hydrolase
MKLLRFGEPGKEQPGVLDDAGRIRSLAGIVDDIAGAALSTASLDKLRALDINSLPPVAASLREAVSILARPPNQ